MWAKAGKESYQVEKRSGVRNESGSDQLADEDGQVWSDGNHAILQILVQLTAVLLNFDDLRKWDLLY